MTLLPDEQPDPRFTEVELRVLTLAANLLADSFRVLKPELSEEEQLDYLETQGALFGMLYPAAYRRMLEPLRPAIVDGLLELQGWAAHGARFEALNPSEQAAVLERMLRRRTGPFGSVKPADEP